MPIDLAKGFATPGAEAKELFRPLNSISGTYQATNELSFGAQYFLEWESFRYPEGGTFLGPADFAFTGPQQQQTAVWHLAQCWRQRAQRQGRLALSARWSPEALDASLGFFYRNYTDKLLSLTATGGARQARPILWGCSTASFMPRTLICSGLACPKTLAVSASDLISLTAETHL